MPKILTFNPFQALLFSLLIHVQDCNVQQPVFGYQDLRKQAELIEDPIGVYVQTERKTVMIAMIPPTIPSFMLPNLCTSKIPPGMPNSTPMR
jgi:hypothetical protein